VSGQPSISEDGTLIAFWSGAPDLITGDTNKTGDVFVRDQTTGTTTRVSVGNGGVEANGNSNYPSISGKGRFVAFQSDATNLVWNDTNQKTDVFVHDRTTGTTRRATIDSNGVESNGWSGSPVLSRDGSLVAFHCTADNLDARKTGPGTDVYVHDFKAKTTELVSVDSNGVVGNGNSLLPLISADRRFVAFSSVATNLDPIAFDGWGNVFLRDLQAGTTTIVSRTCFATSAGGSSGAFAISGDGTLVVFNSFSNDLGAADVNSKTDAYIYDRSIPEPTAVSTAYGSGYPGTHGIPNLSPSGAPVFGSSLTLTIDNSLGQWTPAVLAIGSSQASIPTRAGGTLLVASPNFFVQALPPGGLTIPWSVPLSPAVCGVQVDLQVLELDAGAQYGISFTPGLEWIVGN
jgi:Tol biopolymer transport system component